MFRPWAELILHGTNLASGDRLLDIACGTGIVARIARERLGQTGYVVSVDVSPDMLTVARRLLQRSTRAKAMLPLCLYGMQLRDAGCMISDRELLRTILFKKGAPVLATWLRVPRASKYCHARSQPIVQSVHSPGSKEVRASEV